MFSFISNKQTENCVLKFENELIKGKQNILKKFEELLPIVMVKSYSFVDQPLIGGRDLITASCKRSNTESDNKQYLMTFILEEIDVSEHRYGITNCIVLPIQI